MLMMDVTEKIVAVPACTCPSDVCVIVGVLVDVVMTTVVLAVPDVGEDRLDVAGIMTREAEADDTDAVDGEGVEMVNAVLALLEDPEIIVVVLEMMPALPEMLVVEAVLMDAGAGSKVDVATLEAGTLNVEVAMVVVANIAATEPEVVVVVAEADEGSVVFVVNVCAAS